MEKQVGETSGGSKITKKKRDRRREIFNKYVFERVRFMIISFSPKNYFFFPDGTIEIAIRMLSDLNKNLTIIRGKNRFLFSV